jgi:hypothetical protein
MNRSLHLVLFPFLLLVAYSADLLAHFDHPLTGVDTRALLQQSEVSGSVLRFVVVGDSQDNGSTGGGINDNVWLQMAHDMNSHAPAFALFPGDLVAGGNTRCFLHPLWGA